MSENESRFTVEQAAAANTVLRAALGLPPQRFALAQFVGMISDEIEQLRLAGKTDADIAALLEREIGVTVAADDIRRLYASPAQRRSS
jgi:hypothetical protein